MTARYLATLERKRCGGEERIASHRNRRRSGVRGLADEAHHVALEAERSEHDAGRLAHRLEHRPLLDVHLEVCPRVDARELPARVEHRVEMHAVIAQRVLEPDPLRVLERTYLVDLEPRRCGRRSHEALP